MCSVVGYAGFNRPARDPRQRRRGCLGSGHPSPRCLLLQRCALPRPDVRRRRAEDSQRRRCRRTRVPCRGCARRIISDGISELGLADRSGGLGPAGTEHGAGLDEHGGAHVVAGPKVGEIVVEEVAAPAGRRDGGARRRSTGRGRAASSAGRSRRPTARAACVHPRRLRCAAPDRAAREPCCPAVRARRR